ncbi:MAG: hypothetical protein CVU11_12620 [Bacteroidetes bacterium HGW-Bacteroidetes-6]|jgi:hypothetical protein|nr:MAG: hypothetical protein CVU11_12620 [Bacteroidetes bacterium HGW-Bacteroidetes-6]
MKVQSLKIIWVTIILAYTSVGYSQSKLAKMVMANLKSDSTNWYEELITEKAVPNSNNETIIVLPEFTDSAEMYFSLKTWIIVAENTGKIKTKTFVYMESDAIVLTRFTIDTAPYQVSPDNRAFGIRTAYRGSSKANPYDYESISLFIQQGDSLKIILEDFVIEQYNGEWDTNCAGEFVNQRKVLILSTNLTNGYYDIIVKNDIIKENAFVNELGECDGTGNKTVERTVLRYQNGTYR